jgi:hypothetical protein
VGNLAVFVGPSWLVNRLRLNKLGAVDDPFSCLAKLLGGKVPDLR